jgi:hypothetical protein
MSLNTDPRASAADTAAMTEADAILWQHAAFCELALPVAAPEDAWQREAASLAIRIEPGSAGLPLPGGALLRLAILHVCDAANRGGAAVVELGESAAAMAASLGIAAEADALGEQVARMLAAKITLVQAGGPPLAMFDARSRPRAGAAWRPSVRLNAGFLASLAAEAVALDRGIALSLAGQPLAFDAYAWIRHTLARQAAGPIITTPWDELLARFGAPGAGMDRFRDDFETALRAVFDADLSISLAADDEGVSVGHAAPRAEPAAAPQAAAPQAAAPQPAAPRPAAPSPEPPPRRSAPAPEPARREPQPQPQPASGSETAEDTISLRSHVTGLPQVIWLRRGHGPDAPLVGVTPGARFDADRLTVLAVEPMVMQVSGGLNRQDFDLVSAWVMVNRDLIDGFWEGEITSFEEVGRRVRRVPALSGRP